MFCEPEGGDVVLVGNDVYCRSLEKAAGVHMFDDREQQTYGPCRYYIFQRKTLDAYC